MYLFGRGMELKGILPFMGMIAPKMILAVVTSLACLAFDNQNKRTQ